MIVAIRMHNPSRRALVISFCIGSLCVTALLHRLEGWVTWATPKAPAVKKHILWHVIGWHEQPYLGRSPGRSCLLSFWHTESML
jgi:hypothetical protein